MTPEEIRRARYARVEKNPQLDTWLEFDLEVKLDPRRSKTTAAELKENSAGEKWDW